MCALCSPHTLPPRRRFAFVLFGFANAFLVLFNLSGQEIEYGRILQEQLLWLLNAVDRELFDSLTGVQLVVGDVLFWGERQNPRRCAA